MASTSSSCAKKTSPPRPSRHSRARSFEAIAQTARPTKLLINSRPDIAIATGAHGVHLTAAAGELTTTQVRELYAAANLPAPIITVSCHSLEEVRHARDNRADAILFAPVFEKTIAG